MRAAWAYGRGDRGGGRGARPGGMATAEPVAPGNAYATIGQLEAAGYDVNIDRVGSAPIEQCIVTSVRNPQDITRTIRVDNGARATRQGLRLRDHRGAPDDHRLAQLRRLTVFSNLLTRHRQEEDAHCGRPSFSCRSGSLVVCAAAPDAADFGRCPVRAPTICFNGPSPLGRVPDGGFGGSNLSESRSTCSGRGLVTSGTVPAGRESTSAVSSFSFDGFAASICLSPAGDAEWLVRIAAARYPAHSAARY